MDGQLSGTGFYGQGKVLRRASDPCSISRGIPVSCRPETYKKSAKAGFTHNVSPITNLYNLRVRSIQKSIWWIAFGQRHLCHINFNATIEVSQVASFSYPRLMIFQPACFLWNTRWTANHWSCWILVYVWPKKTAEVSTAQVAVVTPRKPRCLHGTVQEKLWKLGKTKLACSLLLGTTRVTGLTWVMFGDVTFLLVEFSFSWVGGGGRLEVVEWLVPQSCGRVARDCMIVFLPLIACFRLYWNISSNVTAEIFLVQIATCTSHRVIIQFVSYCACQNII